MTPRITTTAALAALLMAAAPAAALAHGGGGGGGGGMGMGGMGGMSMGHMSSMGMAHTNGPNSLDRDFGRDRASDVAHRHGGGSASAALNSNGKHRPNRVKGHQRGLNRRTRSHHVH